MLMRTDQFRELDQLAQQVFGGHGYIEEWGMSQFVRDARIAMIYEGANGIQAMDLVGRKLGKDGGRAVMTFFNEVGAFCQENAGDENLKAIGARAGASNSSPAAITPPPITTTSGLKTFT